jgi:hypothetical protein
LPEVTPWETEVAPQDASRFKTMLYGFYGKTSQSIREFGMKPFKSGRPNKKKPSAS